MADINAHGKTKVGTLRKEFKEAYGVELRVYNPGIGSHRADDSVTLASIRPDGKASGGEIKINAKMLVGNLEKKFMEQLGVKVQIENKAGELADNSVSLSSLA
jgi:hypothetical protein